MAIIGHFDYTRKWTDPDQFPTYEASEEQVREDMQALFDEISTYLNGTLIDWVEEQISGAIIGQIPDRSLTNLKLVLATITGDEIASKTIKLGNMDDDSVDTDQLVDDAVTEDKIADANVTTVKIADSNVTTVKIADSGVTTAKIADANVTTAKIADLAVTSGKIADANVTTAKIADANVTTAKIADANVTTAKIADEAVTMAKLAQDVQDAISSIQSDVWYAGNTAPENTKLLWIDPANGLKYYDEVNEEWAIVPVAFS